MLRITTLFAGLLLATFAQAERIDNIVLLDQHGDAHNLYYHKDKSAIVVMIQGNGCPIVRNALSDYKALRDQYQQVPVISSPATVLRRFHAFSNDSISNLWPKST